MPARAGEPPAAPLEHDYSAAIANYERLAPAERLRFIEHLIVGRLQSAAQLTLDGATLVREREIDHEILTQLRDGQTISPRGLIKLLRKLDTLEHDAVESLSRGYRVEVYSLFHSQRREYDLHIAAWKKVEATWESHGKAPGEQRLLIDWLLAATDRLRADRYGQLPPMPKFAGAAAAPETAAAQPIAPRLADVRPKRLRIEQPHLEPAPAASGQRRFTSHLPPLAGPDSSGSPLANPTSVVAATDPAPPVATPQVPSVAAPASAARPPSASVAEGDAPRSLENRPLVKQSREIHLALKPVLRPDEPQSVAARPKGDSLEPQAGKVDLDELSVRIAGHNLALARLAGRLQDNGPWTIDQLTAGVAELEDLTARRGDLMLYWDLIGDEERISVGTLQLPATTITLLGAKISAARVAAIGQHGDQPVDANDEHSAQFDGLSRRLAQIAGARATP